MIREEITPKDCAGLETLLSLPINNLFNDSCICVGRKHEASALETVYLIIGSTGLCQRFPFLCALFPMSPWE